MARCRSAVPARTASAARMRCASTGSNMLACKSLVRDVGATITVEPLLGLKVVKDLIVDMEPFFDNYKKVLPYFINDSPLPADGRERLQISRAARPLRRHDQVHSVRGLHHLLSIVLGQRRVSTVPPRWWLPIASSSTAATKRPPNACRSSARRTDWRAVIPSTTAPWPARVISRSRRRLAS